MGSVQDTPSNVLKAPYQSILGTTRLWVHFNLLCGLEAQHRLHHVFRHKIENWEKQELVKGTVLTYHFHRPRVPTDSLYVCLDIPAVKEPRKRSIQLSSEAIEQIPSEIMSSMKQICSQNQIKLEIKDYEFAIRKEKARKESQDVPYYRGASVEEILRFASVGTKIALQILDLVETGEPHWTLDKELASFILSRLKKELGENYFWLPEGWHFVCNPLLLPDSYMWILAHADTSTEALDFLYQRSSV